MGQVSLKLKCTGVSLNENKSVSVQFSNPDPGSANYSYMSMQSPEGTFTVGKVYNFTVEDADEETGDPEKMGMA